MIVQNIWYQHVEQYYADSKETDCNLLQLTPGDLNFHSEQVDFDGVVIEWNRTGAKSRSREVNIGRGLLFGFVLDSPSRVIFGGQTLDHQTAILWPIQQSQRWLVKDAECWFKQKAQRKLASVAAFVTSWAWDRNVICSWYSSISCAEHPFPSLPDPDDEPIVASALAGNASVFVTGDKALLQLQSIEHLPIISPRKFWEMLAGR